MIELRQISYHAGETKILKNISLTVEKGRITGLVGESGSGKSTLLKITAGLLDPAAGGVFLHGVRVEPPSEKLIPGHPRIKIVTQHNSLFPNITLAENIAYELRFFTRDYSSKRVKKLLKMTGISHLADRYPREVSGGELQRALIARAVADEPDVLLLDEPYSNLDRSIKKRISFALRKIIHDENIACVFVTHEITDAYGMVDELAVIRKGRILQRGRAEELYLYPANTYVAGLTGDAILLRNDRIPGTLLIRPEDILPGPEEDREGVVTGNIFQGSYYEVWIASEGEELFFRHHEVISPGTRLRFNIRRSVLLSS